MAQTAKTESEKTVGTTKDAASNVSDLGKRVSDKTIDATRETMDKGEDMARNSLRTMEKTADAVGEVSRTVAKRSAEGTAEFGQAFTGVFKDQTQHNVETLNALSDAVDWEQVVKAVDWKQVTQIQMAYVRASMERMAHLTQRYFELSQTAMSATTSVLANRAKRAA